MRGNVVRHEAESNGDKSRGSETHSVERLAFSLFHLFARLDPPFVSSLLSLATTCDDLPDSRHLHLEHLPAPSG